MSAFDPAALLAAAEAAGAKMHLLIYGDGSRALSAFVLGVDWEKMPKYGSLTNDEMSTVLSEIGIASTTLA
jgi:hypothetical protein